MKKILSILTVFAFFATASFAQVDVQEAPAQQEEATGGPVMTFESTEIDYGVIEQHSDPLRVFHFSNTGTEPLVIKHAKGSCGCTVPSYPKEPILPGEAGVIEVRYDTKRLNKFTKSITLTTNEGDQKRILKIKGQVIPPAPEPEGIPASNSGFGSGGK